MIRCIICGIIGILFSTPVKSQSDYLVTDSSKVYLNILKSDPQEVTTKGSGGRIQRIKPGEISEFENNSRKYESVSYINGEGYFMEVLNDGDVRFLSLAEGSRFRYFLKYSDSVLVELCNNPVLLREEIETYLSGLSECSDLNHGTGYILLTPNSLRHFFDSYSSCTNFFDSRFQFGIKAKFGLIDYPSLNGNSRDYSSDYVNNVSYYLGAYFSVPLDRHQYALLVEPYVHLISSSDEYGESAEHNDLIINQTRVQLDVSLKRSFFAFNVAPYIKAGPAFSFGVDRQVKLYSYAINNEDIIIDLSTDQLLGKNLFGYQGGFGFVGGYSSKSYSLGLSYTRLYPVNSTSHDSLSIRDLTVELGFIF